MSDFYFTELEQGEELPFGVSASSNSSSSGSWINDKQVSGSSTSTERKVGITTRRVIVEEKDSPTSTRVIPNADVRTVFIKREKFMGDSVPTVVKLETTTGESVELGMRLFEAADETRLRELFPQATFTEAAEVKKLEEPPKKKKGLFGFGR